MTVSPLESLRRQYERLPYPPVPFLALPRRGEGGELRHHGRILIAGCGTLEAAIVAQANPDALEIVAVDLSAESIAISRRRLNWMRLARPFAKLPPIRLIVGDVSRLDLDEFDFVLASNVLHHCANPPELLRSLAAKLRIGGTLRMVTYPKGSRHWMRETSGWLAARGLRAESPDLVRAARRLIRTLPMGNPIRSCFESQPETRTRAGLVDAFFNACENPLSPLEWEHASRAAGLNLLREGHEEDSRSGFLDEFLGDSRALSAWEKLQVLDDTWELCTNPVFWFVKSAMSQGSSAPGNFSHAESLATQLRRAEALLKKAGKTLLQYQTWLRKTVGPRVNPRNPDELLRGLSLTEYDLNELLLRD